jgi:hypothetical protein
MAGTPDQSALRTAIGVKASLVLAYRSFEKGMALVVVRQKPRPAHIRSRASAPRIARNLATTGGTSCSLFARASAHTTSCRFM